MSETVNTAANAEIAKATYEKVSNLYLENRGAYVCELDIEVFRQGQVHLDGSGNNLCVCQEEEIFLGDYNIEEGEFVTAHLDVKWGSDNVGNTWFIFDPNSNKTACFKATGTTLNNSLEFTGLKTR